MGFFFDFLFIFQYKRADIGLFISFQQIPTADR
jgi:hypothetical protein